MNDELLRRVRALRAKNPLQPISIKHAVDIARYEMKDPATEYAFLAGLEDGPCEIEGQVNGLDVKVVIEWDQDSQLGEDDVTGTFTDEESATTVKNTRRNWGTDYKYYEPANYRRQYGVSEFRAAGMSKSVAADELRAAIEQDMRDDASRQYHGVIVTVSLDGRELASPSLWGIDTIDGSDGRPYFIETAAELIGEAIDQARANAEKTVARAREHAAKLAAAFGAPGEDLARVALPDGEVRIWAPEVHANDLGRMYVLDVFGASLLIREREDGLYVHIDRDGESAQTTDRGPLHVEVANGGENTYGEAN